MTQIYVVTARCNYTDEDRRPLIAFRVQGDAERHIFVGCPDCAPDDTIIDEFKIDEIILVGV